MATHLGPYSDSIFGYGIFDAGRNETFAETPRMKRKTRRLLFYSAVVAFVFLSYVAILYAQGYKYSFGDGDFVRTGAMYLKANTDAKVYLNNEFVGTTSFFGNSFSKGGLVPDQYTVKVERDGYTTWEKNITVQEGFLVEFPRVLILSEDENEIANIIKEIEDLLYPALPSPSPSATPKQTPVSKPKPTAILTPLATPKITEPFYIENNNLYRNDFDPDVIADNVLGFALSPDRNKLAWWNSNNEVWVVWLNDADYQPHRKNGDMERIAKFAAKIKQIGWFRGDDHVVVDSVGYKIVEIDTRGGVNIIRI